MARPSYCRFSRGRVVFVNHGWIFVMVSPNRLRHTTRQTDENEREDKEKTENRLNTIKETAAEKMPVSAVVPAPKKVMKTGKMTMNQKSITVKIQR